MRRTSLCALPLILALAAVANTNGVQAKAPQWLLGLKSLPLPEYPEDVDAVVLLDEGRTVVTKGEELRSLYHIAYKVLTPAGQGLATRRLTFDGETRISELKAWNIKLDGVVHEVSQKDAVETQLFSGMLFADTRLLLLHTPQVEIGSIVWYEWEQRHRPYILQSFWWFQGRYPVLRSRFVLKLPQNWHFNALTTNHPEVAAHKLGENRWVWELTDLAGIPEEEGMSPVSMLAARLAVSYVPGKEVKHGQAFESWDDVGQWFGGLMEPRTAPSEEILSTAGRIGSRRSIAEYVQKQIRYVAIEIGIGGYQPHFAAEVFRNQYGDCKDKVTLLATLSRALDEEIFPVLIHTQRGRLHPDFPSPLSFNHVIAAFRAAEGEEQLPAFLNHPELGGLLLFDPTEPGVPFGQLPAHLQGTKALLISPRAGHIIDTPVASPIRNRLLRDATLQLSGDGYLKGIVKEVYWGAAARLERSVFQESTHDEWTRATESFVALWLPGVTLLSVALDRTEGVEPLLEHYEISAPYFARKEGDLLLFRPCVLGSRVSHLSSQKERRYPLQFPHLSLNSDVFRITLPPGYVVEQLPEPVERDSPYVRYRAASTMKGNVLEYVRSLEIKQLNVPAEEVETLREFYQLVDRDERGLVLLKRAEESSQ